MIAFSAILPLYSFGEGWETERKQRENNARHRQWAIHFPGSESLRGTSRLNDKSHRGTDKGTRCVKRREATSRLSHHFDLLNTLVCITERTQIFLLTYTIIHDLRLTGYPPVSPFDLLDDLLDTYHRRPDRRLIARIHVLRIHLFITRPLQLTGNMYAPCTGRVQVRLDQRRRQLLIRGDDEWDAVVYGTSFLNKLTLASLRCPAPTGIVQGFLI